jgi:hypothetical protein
MKAPSDGWKLGRDSLSKLIVYFKDENKRTFFSIDWNWPYGERSVERGLARLKKKVVQFGNRSRWAGIYDTTTREILHQYRSGTEIEIKSSQHQSTKIEINH